MAELKRIEELCQQVGYDAPDWVYPDYKQTQDGGHLSGVLREASMDVWGDRTGVAKDVLTPDELELTGLLDDAAEHLDDAHQEWLERKLKDRGRKYIVIGRLEFGENQHLICEGMLNADAAQARFEHVMQEGADFVPTTVYIDFIFRIPDVDVFAAQDEWGSHAEVVK